MAKNFNPSVDYYTILGVSKNSTLEELKSARLKLALKFHPDTNKSANAEEKFKEIQEAFDVLSDISSRSNYDSISGFVKKQNANINFSKFNDSDSISTVEKFRENYERSSAKRNTGHIHSIKFSNEPLEARKLRRSKVVHDAASPIAAIIGVVAIIGISVLGYQLIKKKKN